MTMEGGGLFSGGDGGIDLLWACQLSDTRRIEVWEDADGLMIADIGTWRSAGLTMSCSMITAKSFLDDVGDGALECDPPADVLARIGKQKEKDETGGAQC